MSDAIKSSSELNRLTACHLTPDRLFEASSLPWQTMPAKAYGNWTHDFNVCTVQSYLIKMLNIRHRGPSTKYTPHNCNWIRVLWITFRDFELHYYSHGRLSPREWSFSKNTREPSPLSNQVNELSNETDVVGASAMQLKNSVNDVLSFIAPPGIKIYRSGCTVLRVWMVFSCWELVRLIVFLIGKISKAEVSQLKSNK